MVYNPSYNETRWRALKDKTIPMKEILKCASGLGLTLPALPPCDAYKECCPSYHIKGL